MEAIKSKILIVDDEKGLRLGTKRLLENEGYEVSAAANGSEGIRLGSSSEYDIAIIDLKMPDYDGIYVLKEIRKAFPNTVCFIATGYASYESAIEATKIGAYGYIPKPFTPDELLQNIINGLKHRRFIVETERWKQEREERLLEVAFEKTRINTIINSITDGILVVNKNGQAVLSNPGLLKLLGLNNIKIEEYIIDKLHPEIASLINKVIQSNETAKSYSSQVELKSNGELFIEATSSPVPHPDGSLAGVVIVLKNITGLKKLETLKSQFVSMVSHELKAPVAAVYGYLKILADKKINVPEQRRETFIERSLIRLDSLLKIVNDLLDISRIEMKTVHRELQEIDIKEIINAVLDLFQLDLKSNNINASIISEISSTIIIADQNEITRLFTNLISNAIKYNRQNGTIIITIYQADSYLAAEIKDSGIGMKPDEIKNLFQEFYRAKNEFTKNISGTGLGLSIVKRIVDSYSGKIEINSNYNKGTTFRIYLPLKLKIAETKNIPVKVNITQQT